MLNMLEKNSLFKNKNKNLLAKKKLRQKVKIKNIFSTISKRIRYMPIWIVDLEFGLAILSQNK